MPALLSQPSVRELSRDLALRCFLPAAVAVDHPQLLESFQRLAGVQLMGNGSHHDVAERVQPGFFPPSVKIISVHPYSMLTSLGWLPTRRLDRVSIAAAAVELHSPQPQLTIGRLSLSWQIGLHTSVEVLARLDCQHIELTAFSPAVGGVAQLDHPGMLALQPQTADIEQWTDRAARLQAALRPHPSSRWSERLAPWALALHPLFAQRPRLQGVRLVGMELQLSFPAEAAVGPNSPGAGAYWQPAPLSRCARY